MSIQNDPSTISQCIMPSLSDRAGSTENLQSDWQLVMNMEHITDSLLTMDKKSLVLGLGTSN